MVILGLTTSHICFRTPKICTILLFLDAIASLRPVMFTDWVTHFCQITNVLLIYVHFKSFTKGKKRKNCALLTNRGWGGGQNKRKKANLYFGKLFFQWACRIILGPPKHVLHLVPSPNAIAKAFNVMYWSQCPADFRLFWANETDITEANIKIFGWDQV